MPHPFSPRVRKIGLAGFAFALLGCADLVTVPIPDEFDAAFSTGQVCVPRNVATGPGMTYPVSFDLCVYRCIDITPGTSAVRTVYQCAGSQCQMVMLATAHATSDPTEEGCDARDLLNPPAGECSVQSFDFDLAVPSFDSGPVEGDFVVSIPYLELEQGERVVGRLNNGENPTQVIQEEVGEQNYPQRQFALNFSTAHTPVPDHASIPASDCFPISAP